MSEETKDEAYWRKEWEKCKEDPHYFYTNYFTVNGKPGTTAMPKEQFNQFWANAQKFQNESNNRNRMRNN